MPEPQQTTKPATQPQGPAKTASPGPGRPPKGASNAVIRTPEERRASALKNLQYVLDRGCNFIHDGASSFAKRAKTAARAGVPQATVLAGIGALKASIVDLENVVKQAYSKSAPGPAKTRLDLSAPIKQEAAKSD